MDFSKLTRLQQVHIEKPCPEDWNKMEGDEQRRFCAGCGCHVHNIEAMDAQDAEELLASPNRVCARMMIDNAKGILTRDGWIPRLLAAGVVASTVAGCYQSTGEAAMPTNNAAATTGSTKSASVTPPTTNTAQLYQGGAQLTQPSVVTMGTPADDSVHAMGVMPLLSDEKPVKKKHKKK